MIEEQTYFYLSEEVLLEVQFSDFLFAEGLHRTYEPTFFLYHFEYFTITALTDFGQTNKVINIPIFRLRVTLFFFFLFVLFFQWNFFYHTGRHALILG